jgi:hypothetical protein
MRIASPAAALAAALLASPAGAIDFWGGATDLPGCGGPAAVADLQDAELIAVRFSQDPAGPLTDMLFDLRGKGGSTSSASGGLDVPWLIVYDEFRDGSLPSDGRFMTVTVPGQHGDRIVMLSDHEGAPLMSVASSLQEVGNSLPLGVRASIGIAIPGTRTTYDVDLGGTTSAFPRRLPDGGVEIAFAPLAEVTRPNVPRICVRCVPGGIGWDPRHPGRGLIVGYAIHRVPDTGDGSGSPEHFAAALVDDDPSTGFQGFADLRRVDVTIPTQGDPGTGDLDPGDATRLSNPDGAMYSSDEAVLFVDGPSRCPACGTPPAPDQAYWYAAQPVWAGSVDAFANVAFTYQHRWPGDHRIDADGDGVFESLSLDSLPMLPGDSPEFISPQAAAGHDGLGLTVAGRPLISAPMWAAGIPTSQVEEPSALDLRPFVRPLTVTMSPPGAVVVAWEETLGEKFSLYMGSIGSLFTGRAYDHQPAVPCTFFDPYALLPLPPGDVYFLVTAMTGNVESSYGRDSRGRERPPAPVPCR